MKGVIVRSAGVLLLAVAFPTAVNYGRAAETPDIAVPVVVELFTSEGCSSCPPADTLLQHLDTTQPVPGAQIIVLSEHVTYWNQAGWKDPYSSSLLTQRQQAYCHALRVSEPYTPQMIVDGTSELHLSDPQQISQMFQKKAADSKISVRIGRTNLDKAASILRGSVKITGGTEGRSAEVYVAVAFDHAASGVIRGENSGKHLEHVAVVEDLKRVGKWVGGKEFDQDFRVKLKPEMDGTNVRIVAFVQEAGLGIVIGAALQKPPIP